MDSSTLTHWTGPFPTEGVSGQFLLLPCFMKIPVFNANSVDSDDAFCMWICINNLDQVIWLAEN